MTTVSLWNRLYVLSKIRKWRKRRSRGLGAGQGEQGLIQSGRMTYLGCCPWWRLCTFVNVFVFSAMIHCDTWHCSYVYIFSVKQSISTIMRGHPLLHPHLQQARYANIPSKFPGENTNTEGRTLVVWHTLLHILHFTLYGQPTCTCVNYYSCIEWFWRSRFSLPLDLGNFHKQDYNYSFLLPAHVGGDLVVQHATCKKLA